SKQQFYSALSTTVAVGVVSVGLSMCPALAIFGIPLAGALGEWSRKHGGDLNPRPIQTVYSLTVHPPSLHRVFSPIDLSTARERSVHSPLPTVRSIPRENTSIDHSIRTANTQSARSPLPKSNNLNTAKCVSPLRGNEEMERWQLRMVREVIKTAVENNEMTARSGLSEDDVCLAVKKTVIHHESDISTAKESNDSSPRPIPRTPNGSREETNEINEIALSPVDGSKRSATSDTGQKTDGSLSSPSPLLFTPPMVKVTPQLPMRSTHMTSTSERPRVKRHRKRSREKI
ncbi:hypothetical protein PENTCL1PPCAC_17667, partial [Pristionchus entomophagus]